jgi:Ca2+-binding RTX toxin-like protein
MRGGLGNDTFVVDSLGDVVQESASQGFDTVLASVSHTAASNIERLVLTGADAIDATGNGLANVLIGNSAANTLSGLSGADTMFGRLGDDTYIVDNTGDVVIELAGEGSDTVASSASYTLAANVETLVLSGTRGISGTGNDLDNVITGNSGNNVLDGGLGADTIVGMLGNDTFVVDNAGDVVIEASAAGTELIKSSVSYALSANIEKLTLTGSGSIDATGNELANTLTGNAGSNVLDGGSGNDTMAGGAGDDTYFVDSAGDVVTEAATAGVDAVYASVGYTLAANIELLTLTGAASSNATGNTLANLLTGNAGDNILDGKSGGDTLVGGLGNDTYIIDNIGDVVVELSGGGTETVQSSVAYTLGADIENLLLAGTGAIAGTGNGLDNLVTGNAGANRLDGGAGNDRLDGLAGNDTLIGGSGSDTFLYGSAYGRDTITDFTVSGSSHDMLEISSALFADWAALQGAITDSASGAVITLNSTNTLTLTGVSKADLTANQASDIKFV